MSELRWHPLLREWVSVAAARQNRPQMPKDWCPFCPGLGKVPTHYDTLLYSNDFAAFSPNHPPFEDEPGLFAKTGGRGACDVVLYHPDHNLTPSAMPADHWAKVVELWRERTDQLFANPDIAYLHIFENAGEAIGVTMPHPHGQIYALPMVPPLVQRRRSPSRESIVREPNNGLQPPVSGSAVYVERPQSSPGRDASGEAQAARTPARAATSANFAAERFSVGLRGS